MLAHIKSMISHKPEKRPNSEKVLGIFKEWLIEGDIVSPLIDFETTINALKEFEIPFFFKYFNAKMQFFKLFHLNF